MLAWERDGVLGGWYSISAVGRHCSIMATAVTAVGVANKP